MAGRRTRELPVAGDLDAVDKDPADAGRLGIEAARATRQIIAGPHRLVTDSSAGSLMAQGLVDRIVVGADRIAANGDTANKIGTYALAALAQRHEVPFVVVAPTSTIDHEAADGDAIPIEERASDEITSRYPATNPAFDVTPAALIAAIVTEDGVRRGALVG